MFIFHQEAFLIWEIGRRKQYQDFLSGNSADPKGAKKGGGAIAEGPCTVRLRVYSGEPGGAHENEGEGGISNMHYYKCGCPPNYGKSEETKASKI